MTDLMDHAAVKANSFGPDGPGPDVVAWPHPTMQILHSTMGAQYTGLGVEVSNAEAAGDGTSVVLVTNSPFIANNNLVQVEGYVHYPNEPYPTSPTFICYPNFKADGGIEGKKFGHDLRIYATSHDTDRAHRQADGSRPLAIEQQIIRGVFRS